MDATKFLNDRAVRRQNEALQHVLSTLPDSAENRHHLKGLRSAAENRIDSFKQKLREKYYSYAQPVQTILSCVSLYENAKLKAVNEDRVIEQLTLQNRANPMPIQTLGYNQIIRDLNEPYVKVGDAYYPIDFFTGMALDTPLLNPSPPIWSDIESKVLVLSGTSNAVHTIDTLDKLVDFAKDKGLSKDDLSCLMKSFVQNHIPHLSGTIFMKGDADSIFETILNSVNFYTITENIRKAISKLTRVPMQPIEEVLQSYESLLCELAFIESPSTYPDDAVKKARKAAMRAAKHFVHPNVASQIDELRKQNSTRFDEELTIKDLIEFITIEEVQDKNKLQSNVSLAGKHVPLSIFHTQFQQSLNTHSYNTNVTQPESNNRPIYQNVENTTSGLYSRPYSPSNSRPNYSRQGNNSGNYYNYPNRSKSPANHYQNRPNSPGNYRRPISPGYYNTSSGNHNRPTSPGYYNSFRGNNDRSKSPSNYSSSRPSSSNSNNFSNRPNTPTRNVFTNNYAGPTSPRSSSPGLWIRSASGNRFDRVSRSRVMSKSPSRQSFSKNRQFSSERGVRRSSRSTSRSRRGTNLGRRNSYAGLTEKPRSRGRSPNKCKLCGGTSHVTPTESNKQLCPIYGKGPVQTKPCLNCKHGLYHPNYACQHGHPVRPSRANSLTNSGN